MKFTSTSSSYLGLRGYHMPQGIPTALWDVVHPVLKRKYSLLALPTTKESESYRIFHPNTQLQCVSHGDECHVATWHSSQEPLQVLEDINVIPTLEALAGQRLERI